MPSSTPLISIITPSFNQGKYLEHTIQSVLNQDYPNLEYIIIDGGSTDNSVEIIKKYESQLTYWVSEPDRGQTHALNKGFSKAKGDITAWLNSDDFYEDNCLKRVSSIFNKSPDTDIICGHSRTLNSDGSRGVILKTRQPHLYPLIHHARLMKNEIPTVIPHQPSVFMRKKVMNTVGKLDESLHYSMDYDLWLHCIERRFRFEVLDEVLSNYLFHDSSKSNQGWDAFMEEWTLVSRQHKDKFSTWKKLQIEAWWIWTRYVKYGFKIAERELRKTMKNGSC